LHRLHRLNWLPRLMQARHQRQPSLALLLVAGLAVFAFVKLMSAANRPNRSRAEAVLMAALVIGVGAFLMSLRRRSARRYAW
jgi:hypothetical protein